MAEGGWFTFLQLSTNKRSQRLKYSPPLNHEIHALVTMVNNTTGLLQAFFSRSTRSAGKGDSRDTTWGAGLRGTEQAGSNRSVEVTSRYTARADWSTDTTYGEWSTEQASLERWGHRTGKPKWLGTGRQFPHARSIPSSPIYTDQRHPNDPI